MTPVPKTSFRVYKTNDARTIIENPWRDGETVLEIKDTGVTVGARQDLIPTSHSAIISTQEVMGLIGILELSFGRRQVVLTARYGSAVLIAGKYLLVVTARTLAATIQNHKIWRVTGGLYIPIGGRSEAPTLAGTPKMDHLDENELGKVHTYQTVLISRINHRRLGTRYVRRGLDNEGNSANNVEMEQIVFHHDYLKDKSITSYCQIRGSVPTIWGQDLDLSYRPRLVLTDINKETVWSSIKMHYNDLKCQYIGEKSVASSMDNGLVVCINLLDDTGFEGPLTTIYENTVKRFNDPKIRYESFPMNKWCKKMNFTNMEILVDRVRLPLVNSGWFVAEGEVPSLHSKGSLRVSKIQTGTVRVSCLDSLDRTNVTCSLFARYMVPYQVQSISPGLPAVQVLPATGVSPNEVRDPVASTRKALEDGYGLLTNLWADSGDSISLIYAGTGALKSDVTRTGKRQVFQGSYNDGLNSLTRYYLNNFTHGHLQDTYDLLTGKTKIDHVLKLAEIDGPRKAERLKRPLISRTSFPGSLVPSVVLDLIEPIYFNVRETLEEGKKKPNSASVANVPVANKVVLALKEVAPGRIENLLQLWFGLTIFFWIVVISKLMSIKGQLVVDIPRLSREKETLKELSQ
ncbi:hypothetical protein HDU91_004855 [Kappamyces sp. JEL0680]|nr:hypothetical protein HDU91_004855 [Kappamyces sp. JEL0680]